jgi:HEPN domain-containing protein
MTDREHAQALLEMAEKDFKALQGMLDAAAFDDEIFGFHAQQAVEKSLKAWIAFLGKRYSKTHDLDDLLDELEDAGQDVKDLGSLVDLNPFAVQFRYEAGADGDTPVDRQSLLQDVAALIARIKKVFAT